MIWRRLRGLGVATLVGATIWGVFGLLVGLAIVIAARLGVGRLSYVSTSPAVPGGLVGATTLLGLIVGAINGLAFGLLLLAAERGRAVDRIPWWRFGLWGAAATGATGWMAVRVPVIAAGCAVLGGAASVAALALARRAPNAVGAPSPNHPERSEGPSSSR